MRRASRLRRAWICAGLALAPATGCVGNTAPTGFLLTPVQAQNASYGGWIELTIGAADGGKRERTEGELLAVTADSIWVLGPEGAVVIATARVTKGKLTAYQAATAAVSGWAGLGTLSTISNGLLLVFTAPLWIITGTAAAATESRTPVRAAPPLTWPQLAMFARFPQGMPAGVTLESLQPKPE